MPGVLELASKRGTNEESGETVVLSPAAADADGSGWIERPLAGSGSSFRAKAETLSAGAEWGGQSPKTLPGQRGKTKCIIVKRRATVRAKRVCFVMCLLF
jgi:hypothetical protein